jgi:hypothetical protein
VGVPWRIVRPPAGSDPVIVADGASTPTGGSLTGTVNVVLSRGEQTTVQILLESAHPDAPLAVLNVTGS